VGADALAELERGVRLERFYRPQVVSKAEFLQGDLDTQAATLASKVIRAGGL
jgi:hypothetical protein